MEPSSPSLRPSFPVSFACYRPASHTVCGSVCISPTNRILLVKGAKTGKWSFPKGKKKTGELYVDCAIRETYEETGISLQGRRPMACHRLSVGEYFFYELEEEMEIQPRDTWEIGDAGWFSLEDARALDCNVDVNHFLERIRRGIKKQAQEVQEP